MDLRGDGADSSDRIPVFRRGRGVRFSGETVRRNESLP